MKLNKKVISIFMVVLFAIGLAACGNTTTQAPTTAAPTTTAAQTTQSTTQQPTTTGAVTTTEPATTQTTAPTTTAPVTTINLLDLIDQLKTQYADTLENENFLATENLTLVDTLGVATVTWSSNNTAYLENDGTVHRPTYTEGDQTVILTATLSYGDASEDYSFFVTVQALPKSDAERAADVFLVVCAFPAKDLWTSADTLVLPTEGQDAEENTYTVTWESDHPEIISTDGVITQPEGADVVVTLTAYVTINGNMFAHSVEFTVAKMLEGTPVNTIAEGIALGADSYVKFLGVTVIAQFPAGQFFFTDGTDIMYVYTTQLDVTVGEVYDISGIFVWYYNAPELTGSGTMPLKVEASDAAVTSTTPVVGTVSEVLAAQHVPSADNPYFYQMYTVTGKVYYDESLGNYSTFLVPADYDTATPLDTAVTDALMIYYQSDMSVLSALAGKVVTVNILMYGWRTDKLVYYGNFFGGPLDVDMVIADDTEAVTTALDILTYPGEITANTTLQFPESLYGVTLTYASSNNALIDPTTGAVDVSTLTTQVEVTLTITATRGAVTQDKTVTIKLGELPLSTPLEVQAVDAGTKVKVQGIVNASEYYHTYMIQDENGGIAVYTSNSDLLDFLAANVGNKVEIIGTKSSPYHGLLQISPETITLVEESTLPDPVNLDGVEITAETFMPYQNMLIELTGLYVSDVYVDGYGNVTLTLVSPADGTSLKMKWDSRVTLSTEAAAALDGVAVGDTIDVIAGLAWYDAPFLYYTDSTVLTEGTAYTSAELLAFDVARFPTDVTLDGNFYLPELPFTTVSNVAISTELQAYLTDDVAANGQLVLVRPIGADVTGTVTFTVDLGELTQDVTVNVTLTGMTDQEVANADAAALETSLNLDTDYVLPTPLYGSTLTVTGITGDAAAFLDYTTTPGTIIVTQPSDTDKVGVITIEVTYGTATAVVVNIDVTVISAMPTFDLFISEYAEGSSNNKWLEIYNPTDAAIDLSNYTLVLYSNGATDPTYTQTLSGTIAAGDVFVVINSDGVLPEVIAAADVASNYGSTVCVFNGDDAVVLAKDGVAIDMVGVVGEDPGSYWVVGDGSTQNHTLVRNPSIHYGNTTFTPEEWVVYAEDSVDSVGAHSVISELFISEYSEGSSNNKWIEIYNGTGLPVDLSNYSLVLYSNGATDPTYTEALSGTIAAGDVFVVANASVAVQAVIDNVDLLEGAYPNGVCFFNGDDAVALAKDGVNIDVFGVIGEDPGSSWVVGDGTTQDHVLVRDPSVIAPTTTWDANQWIVYAADTGDYIGSHVVS